MTMLDMLRGFRHPPPHFASLLISHSVFCGAFKGIRVVQQMQMFALHSTSAAAQIRAKLYDLFIKLKLSCCFRSATVCRWLQFPLQICLFLYFFPLSLTAVLYALCFISKMSQRLIQNICALLREKARFSALVCPNAPFEQVWAKSHIKLFAYIQPRPSNSNRDLKVLLISPSRKEVCHRL